MVPGQLLLDEPEAGGLEFHEIPAGYTPKVVVSAVSVDVFVMPMAVRVVNLPNQAAIDEQPQGSIDGGLRDF